MIEYISIFCLALFIRLLPVRLTKIDFDTWGHLYFALEINRQKKLPWESIKLKCWESDNFRHPYLWHWIVGKFSIENIISKSKWINGIIDSIFVTFIYYILIKQYELQSTALLGVLLYLFTPMWYSSISLGTRIGSFTPRLISEIMVNLILILVLLDTDFPKWIEICLAIIATSIVILTSKFGVQVVLFMFPLICAFSGSYTLLLSVLIGVIVPIIISGGQLFKMLKRQLAHLSEYYSRNKAGKAGSASNRNKFNNLIVRSNTGINLYDTLWNFISVNSYTSVIIKMPIYIILLMLSIFSIFKNNFVYTADIYAPVISASILFVLINRPNLLFLGEAERYLNHVALFTILAFINIAQLLDINEILFGVVIYGFIYWLLETFLLSRLGSQEERKNADQIIEKYLIGYSEKKVIASFPYHNFCLGRILVKTKHSVIWPVNMVAKYRENFIEDFEYRYPYLDLLKLDEIKKMTSLDTIILDKKALINESFENWVPSKEWKKIELQQSVYDVYER